MPRLETRIHRGLCIALLGLLPGLAAGAGPLTIVSWGGAYEHSQRKAYFEPFTEQTGIPIEVVQYNGGIDDLRDQVESGRVRWDVVDLVKSDAIQACDAGLLERIDPDMLPPAPDGTPADEDFYDNALGPCSVGEVIYATVVAFNVKAFPGRKPRKVGALFDLEDFPGKRALQRQPIAILEWALRSYGVPVKDIYNLLSTRRGLDLAFERLDAIRNEIVWWEDGSVPAKLLAEGKVVMASGYNGRFFDTAINDGAPIQTIWDAQLYDYSVLGIPRGARNEEAARRFVRFATRTEQLAAQAKYISYGPARRSSSDLVGQHARTGIDIRPHLPTYPRNFDRAIRKDHEWYARTNERLRKRFSDWLGR